uniref:Transposase n=1 Tax=Acrobeloides nanus TaxID=290746 RepID=A0A914E7Q7_9BILA
MAKAIGVGQSSVMRILHEDLGMSARKMVKAHGLTEKGKEKRLIRCKVLPWARRTYRGQHWVWQEDGAPSHKAIATRDLVKNIFPEVIDVDISPQRDNGEWPPNSPDLNVMDYSIWSILEAEACAKPYQSIETLKKSLMAAWKKIPQDMIDRAVDDFPKRLKKCIDAEGGHFENK